MAEHIYESAIRARIASQSTDTKQQLQQFSGHLFDTISQGLLQDGHVRIHQFGSFKLNWAKQRRGRHPRTGEPLIIPAQPRISFTPAKALKDQLNAEPAGVEPAHSSLRSMADDKIELATKPATPISQPSQSKNRVATGSSRVATGCDNIATDIADSASISRPHPVLNRKTALAASIIVTLLATVLYWPGDEHTNPPLSDSGTELNPASESALTQAHDQHLTTMKQLPASPGVTADKNDTVPAVLQTTDSTTAPQAAVAPLISQSAQPYFQQRKHKLLDGDSLWRLSRKHYRNPFFWPYIYRFNHSQIDNPDKLIIGSDIQLPSLLGTPDKLSPQDRRSIAEGYFLVYRYHKKTNRAFPYYALLGANKFDPAVIQEHISEIDEKDWHSLQLASN